MSRPEAAVAVVKPAVAAAAVRKAHPAAKAPRAKPRKKDSPAKIRGEFSPTTDWEDLMAMADLDGVRVYAMHGKFERGEVIQHKAFGLGIVVREAGEGKIEVSFRDGLRLLVCNYQK